MAYNPAAFPLTRAVRRARHRLLATLHHLNEQYAESTRMCAGIDPTKGRNERECDILLRFRLGVPHKEIAEHYQLSRERIRQIIHRAIRLQGESNEKTIAERPKGHEEEELAQGRSEESQSVREPGGQGQGEESAGRVLEAPATPQ